MDIEYVNHGIGNRFSNVIELNENLKKYPSLHRAILNHELRHTDKKGFTRSDFTMDLTETKVDKAELLKFMVQNPRSFSQFLPCYFTKKHGFVYDINMIIIYFILFFFSLMAFYLAFSI